VRRLITLGTPHNGAALALPLVLGYEKRLFLSKDQVLQATSDPRYPTAYQLLPAVGELFAWNGAADQQLEPLDIYNEAVAKPLGLVAVWRDNLDEKFAAHGRAILAVAAA